MIVGSILKLVLTVISLISFLLGASLSFIGIWILSNKNKLRSMLNLLDSSKLPDIEKHKAEVETLLDKYDVISSVGIAILIIGGFIALISICGGLGSMLNMKILLIAYICITGVLFVSLLIGLIYFGTLKARMMTELLKKMREVQDNYLISIISMIRNQDSVKAVVTVSINFMHIALKCCGVDTVGDARNSTSWLGSERRIMELSKEGVPFPMPPMPSKDQQQLLASGDNVPEQLLQADDPPPAIPEASGKDIPDWLKPLLPSTFKELPADVKVPSRLPAGFELPADFKGKLKDIIDTNMSAVNLNKAFNDALTIRTPMTCCELSNVDELLKGNYDAKKAYENMKDMKCSFSPTNVGVNKLTCHQALIDYISHYQHVVITVGTILACVMGAGVFAALWIFLFE